MSCNIVFDFHSPHNNEYWFKCTTCGARDWFAYHSKPDSDKPIGNCVIADLADLSREQLLEQIMNLRKRVSVLEDKIRHISKIANDP